MKTHNAETENLPDLNRLTPVLEQNYSRKVNWNVLARKRITGLVSGGKKCCTGARRKRGLLCMQQEDTKHQGVSLRILAQFLA